jgi:negative regulator of flagellin synthesis FlgM
MGIDIRGLAGRPVGSSGAGQTKKTKGDSSGAGKAGAAADSSDTMSLTGSASKLQELEAHIASLPIVDATHIADVQRALATGSYQFEPIDAAESLIAQEKEFATLDKKE